MSAAWVERMARDPVLQRHLPGTDLASALARMDLSQRGRIPGLLQGLEASRARIDAARARFDAERAARVVAEAQTAEARARRIAAEARIAESNRRIAELHANDQFPAGG